LLAGLASCLALSALADGPTIKDVVVRQRWPWSRLVDINYILICDPLVKMDVTMAAKNGAVRLTLPPESLSGDNLHGISQGAHYTVWDPEKAGYTNEVLGQFNAEFTVTPIPLYMIVDLTLSTNDANQITSQMRGGSTICTATCLSSVWNGVR